MTTEQRPRHLLHAFSTFQLGGPQVRFVELANALGPMFRHTVVAMDNRFDAGERLHPSVNWAPMTLKVIKGGALANRASFRQVLRSHAGARLSRDSAFRLCDQALDLVEDGPVVPDAQARSMMAQLQARGLTVARSSVHINAWVGEYGKAQMVEKLLRRRKIALDQCAYAGDSRNDGPLFRLFPHSVGVANVRPLLPELASRGETPRYITAAPMGRGFSQLVQRILKDQPQRRGARA